MNFFRLTKYYYIDEESYYDGIVEVDRVSVSQNKYNDRQNKYICIIKSGLLITSGEQMKPKGLRLTFFSEGIETYMPGDMLYVEGMVETYEKSKNYKGFNNRIYNLQNKNIGRLDYSQIRYLKRSKDVIFLVSQIRKNSTNILNNLYDKNDSNVLKCILLGDKEELDEDIKEDFRNSSLSHILAISGMHVAYVIMIIEKMLQEVNFSKKIKNIVCVVILIFFIALTGMSASCMRACMTYIYVLIGKNLNRKSNSYRTIAISFIIICLLNSYSIYDVGLWLSYMATLGILFFYKLISIILKRLIKIEYIRECFSISISAQIMIIPIVLFNFNTINLSFLIPNVLISVIIGPLIIMGYLSMVLGLIFMPIAIIISKIEAFVIHLCYLITRLSSILPFSKIYITTPMFAEIILYYLALIFLMAYFLNNKYKIIRKIIKIKKKVGMLLENKS